MIERYTLPKMEKVWAEENRFQKMLEVELAVCRAWAKKGKIPKKDMESIEKKAGFDLERIKELEKKTQHEVVAFIDNLSENLGELAKYIHLGLTSSDILDTSLAMLLLEASDILLGDLENLTVLLKRKAKLYRNTIMAGRTHGIHAEPITLGLKLAGFYAEGLRNLERLKQAKEVIGFGKISGAVGNFSHIEPEIEEMVCTRLGLKPEPVSTQIIPRDRYAVYLSTLAIIGGFLERLALEIRHLQRTEVLEVEEPFAEGQRGSSAMPHKRNPVLSERICGLARLLRSYAQAGMENISLWHERDISHSSVERIILPDATTLLDYMLNLMIYILDKLIVYPDNMRNNLRKTGGLIFSQRVLLTLMDKGLPRQKAYDLVQRVALICWKEKRDFQELLLRDKEIRKYLEEKEIRALFDLSFYLRNIDKIFHRVGL
ncbi:MAG: adenylosuccinate lyase [Candidatus Omnitrophica bacterium]|nr:adenylosuccinate lyase [Candidatus Omnitrophota bacterium]MCM8793682.1 adenylosuccinate lyase [Candidatus Omnitrophota bacterium]